MRLAVIVSLMALGSVTVLDGTTRGLRWARRAQQRRRHGLPVLSPSSKTGKARQHGSCKEANGSTCDAEEGLAGWMQADEEKPGAAAAAAAGPAGPAAPHNCCRISADGSQPASCVAVPVTEGTEDAAAAAAAAAAAESAIRLDDGVAVQQGSQQSEGESGRPATAAETPRTAGRSFALAQQQAASFARPGNAAAGEPIPDPPPRPELALARGLSRRVRDLSTGRPRLVRLAALTVITSSFSAAYCCQIAAPGFVDPSLGEQRAGLEWWVACIIAVLHIHAPCAAPSPSSHLTPPPSYPLFCLQSS